MRLRLLLKLSGAILSGLLLASAYPPLDWYGAAWLAMIPLLAVARFSTPWRGFGWGFVSGFVFWLCSLAWLLRLAVTGAPAALAYVGWISLSLYCALFTALFALAASWWMNKFGAAALWKRLVFTFAMPVLWAGLEYLRSTLFTGFPWNALGVSQYSNLAVCQLAEWGGVYLVSALVMLANCALIMTVLKFGGARVLGRYSAHPEMLAALLLLALTLSHGGRLFIRPEAPASTVKVIGIQLNVPQLKKWPEEWAPMIYEKLSRLSGLARTSWAEMTIWPETAVPSYALSYDIGCREFVDEMLANGTPILAGSLDSRMINGSELCFNSSILFEPSMRAPQVYDKRHLVPIGEYVPLGGLIPALERLAPLGWSCAAGTNITVFSLEKRPDVRFCSLICFEDAFPALARQCVRAGARFLVNQTNDAWFDGSSGARQHLAHCVFRCIENRVAALRVANSGISCLIDRNGRIVRDLATARFVTDDGIVIPDPFRSVMTTGFLAAVVPLADPGAEPTFYTRHGDVFAASCAAVTVACFLLVAVRGMGLHWWPLPAGKDSDETADSRR